MPPRGQSGGGRACRRYRAAGGGDNEWRAFYTARRLTFCPDRGTDHGGWVVGISALSTDQPADKFSRPPGRQGKPRIDVVGPYIDTHTRHFLQQSRYTICSKSLNIDVKELKEMNKVYFSHEAVQFQREQDILKKYTLPASERKKVMGKLDLMNINSFTLFGGDENLMSTLAYREIERGNF